MLTEKVCYAISSFIPKPYDTYEHASAGAIIPVSAQTLLDHNHSKEKRRKNEICPHPIFNSSIRLQLRDLILTSPPEALTWSLQTHSKDSVLALDAGLNQGLTGASWLGIVCLP